MTDQPQVIIKPKVMLEQRPNGDIMIEYYINGARTQELVPSNYGAAMVMQFVAEAFDRMRQVATTEIERKRQKQELEEKQRHRRVWFHSAYARGQGENFANRVIGPLSPKSPKPKGVEATEDLI